MSSRRSGVQDQGRDAIPRVRRMGFTFTRIPRHWLDGSVLATHRANALGLLFPAGERFFIHSVKHYLPHLTDPVLRARVRAFLGQESSHGYEHQRAFGLLEAQGYELREWLRWYERLASELLARRLSPAMQLSMTVALEHLTTAMARVCLSGRLLERAHPQMQLLLSWHAAEELEHKSVAFDVLAAVAPGYWLRVLGIVLGGAALVVFWRSAMRMLLRQELDYSRERMRREAVELARAWGDRRTILAAVMVYLRPGFHPDQRDDAGLASRSLERIGRPEG